MTEPRQRRLHQGESKPSKSRSLKTRKKAMRVVTSLKKNESARTNESTLTPARNKENLEKRSF